MIFKVIVLVLNVFGWFMIYRVANQFIFFHTRQPVAVEQVVKHKVATVSSAALNMRDQPSTNGSLLRTLKKGDRLTVSGEVQDGWIPVEIEGTSGFVNGSYISIEEE
jgi:uncharacterized protein YgiM (DUF1202 family)